MKIDYRHFVCTIVYFSFRVESFFELVCFKMRFENFSCVSKPAISSMIRIFLSTVRLSWNGHTMSGLSHCWVAGKVIGARRRIKPSSKIRKVGWCSVAG